MKRKIKNSTGLYSFLDAFGILEHGTGKEIEQAKQQYWKDYRRKYNKIKRRENKSFQILFNFNEAKIIAREAEKHHCSPPNYIKQSALSNKQNIIDKVAIAEIRELVIVHHTTLINLTEENKLSHPINNRLLNQASQIEEKVLAFLSSKK